MFYTDIYYFHSQRMSNKLGLSFSNLISIIRHLVLVGFEIFESLAQYNVPDLLNNEKAEFN